jgi:hypothetical protein
VQNKYIVSCVKRNLWGKNMLFEVWQTANEKVERRWFVRHIMSQNDVMGIRGGLKTEAQARAYAAEFEASPFIWYFTDPQDLKNLNDMDALIEFVTTTRKKVMEAK